MLTINPLSAKSREQKTKKSQKSGEYRGKVQESTGKMPTGNCKYRNKQIENKWIGAQLKVIH
jgi:hypothetical protein